MFNDLEDEDLAVLEAKLVLQKIMGDTRDAANVVSAIEALIEIKMAVMMETMADRVQDAMGVRP